MKIGTAAGGGLVVVEEVSTGTASGSANTGEFVFQTGVALAPDIQTFTVKWTAINPFPGLAAAPTIREIGGFVGTGDQSNFLKPGLPACCSSLRVAAQWSPRRR